MSLCAIYYYISYRNIDHKSKKRHFILLKTDIVKNMVL